MRTWKCDTNWGGIPLLDVFVDFKVVFFGTADVVRLGHYKEVEPGDIIGISKGTEIVALAMVRSRFESLSKLGQGLLPRAVMKDYAESGVDPVGCRISDVMWLDRPIVNGKRMMRFFELPNGTETSDAVKQAWQRHIDYPEDKKFDIVSATKTFVAGSRSDGLFSRDSVRYVVPVYQRPYAWGEQEITRLLDDIVEGMKSSEKKFFGSIQVSAPRQLDIDGRMVSYELIDGQQRVTTLLIVLKHLGHDYCDKFRTAVSAGSAQADWDEFNDEFKSEPPKNGAPLNNYAVASRIVGDYLHDVLAQEGITEEKIVKYIEAKLLFVVIQTAATISRTIQIFNVINTAGMDLSTSDLFKIRFYEYLTSKSGADEKLFEHIASCYKMIEDYNRETGSACVSMGSVLSLYQKVLVAKYKLSGALFDMSPQRFYEELFDCLNEHKHWEGFSDKGIELGILEFQRAVEIVIAVNRQTRRDAHLAIARNFMWETRYGWEACQFLEIACYFEKVSVDDPMEMIRFVWELFKRLVPPSLCYAKKINETRARLIEFLRTFPSVDWHEETAKIAWGAKGELPMQMLQRGLQQDLVYSPKWKNLVCKLVEYLKSDCKDAGLKARLFETSFDIEHIRSYTDEKDRDKVWKDWGWELNGLGNLVMLEFSLNRSIHNESNKKLAAYAQSRYQSIKEISQKMTDGVWTLAQARKRREKLAQIISSFLFDGMALGE